MPQIAEAMRKTPPHSSGRRGFDAVRPVIPKITMAEKSISCPTTHHPPGWTNPLLMSAGENLHDRAATGVAIAFDDVALNLSINQQFHFREFFPKNV